MHRVAEAIPIHASPEIWYNFAWMQASPPNLQIRVRVHIFNAYINVFCA